MASFGAFNRDFLTTSWGPRSASASATFATAELADVAPDTERSPAYQSETRIGLGRPPESLVMVVETDLDHDAEPPTVRTWRRSDYDAAALEGDDEDTDSIDVTVFDVLRPSEPTLLCAGVVRSVAPTDAVPVKPSPPALRVVDDMPIIPGPPRLPRMREPSAPAESEVARVPTHSGVWPAVVSEHILGAVCDLASAARKWL